MSADDIKSASERSGVIGFLDGLDRLIGLVCKSVVITTGMALLVAIAVAVVARYVITVGGIDWSEELPRQLFSWFIMAGVVLALQTGHHIAVDLIMQWLSSRAKRILIAGSNLLVGVAYLYLMSAALEVAEIASIERNPMLGTPNSLPFYAVGVGSGLTAIAAFSLAIRVALLGESARPQANHEESVV